MKKNTHLDPSFIFFDGVSQHHLNQLEKDAKPALSEAERYSLDKTSKSPTKSTPALQPKDMSTFEPIVEIELGDSQFESFTEGPGCYTVIQHREWSNEYRIRTSVETSTTVPPLNDGPRKSLKLSARGARKISDSCSYMASSGAGYQTFVTGTFNREARNRIKINQTTIQKEVSRTMDALQKIFQRGWTTSTGVRVCGNEGTLPYCWVVEIPMNNEGEENPHIHILLGWSVPFELFQEWRKRIESVWANGYFHLEKIRDPNCAGAYMAKAAGYMSKGAKSEKQGTVLGNRYGISKVSRAPEWSTIRKANLGIMGKLIAEMHNTSRLTYGHLFEEREKLKGILNQCSKRDKRFRIAIGKNLEKVRKKIREIPQITSKYQIIFKGEESFNRFIGYSLASGWKHSNKPISMWAATIRMRFDRKDYQNLPAEYLWSDKKWIEASEHYESYLRNMEHVSILQHYDLSHQGAEC